MLGKGVRAFQHMKKDQIAVISILLSFLLGMFIPMMYFKLSSPGPKNRAEERMISSAQPTPKTSPGKLTPPEEPMHAVQFLNLDCQTWEEVAARLAELKAAKIQAVIFRVFHNPGDGFYPFVQPRAESGVYFKTAQVPVVADALGKFCELAHNNGLKVYAWMTTRYADYGHESESELRVMAWDFATGKVVPAKGDSPLLPAVQARLLALFTDLAQYPIDGALIQDDLMLKHNEDLGPPARALYEKATGRPADPKKFFKEVRKTPDGDYLVTEYSPEFYSWRRWENGQLLVLAQRLRQAVHQSRPTIPFGINLYYETVTAPDQALVWYAQDLQATLRTDLDFYSLMLYHRQMMRELNLPAESVFALIEKGLKPAAAEADFPQRLLIKIQAVDFDTRQTVPREELEALIRRVKALGPVSLALVMSGRAGELELIK